MLRTYLRLIKIERRNLNFGDRKFYIRYRLQRLVKRYNIVLIIIQRVKIRLKMKKKFNNNVIYFN